MSDSVMPTLPVTGDDKLPLPLLIAKKWNFALQYNEMEHDIFYSVDDWIRGVMCTTSPGVIWGQMKSRNEIFSASHPFHLFAELSWRDSTKKWHLRDFATH